MQKVKKLLTSSKFLRVSLFIIVYLLYFSFGLHHLTKFATADETIWWIYNRVPKYWNAILSGNLEKTYINDKPGVSTAMISGLGYLASKDSFEEKVALRLGIPNGYKRVEKQDLNIEKNLLYLRLPILIFNALFSLLLFWLIKNFTGNFHVAFWSFTLILLSPILLGISQIINPDSFLWSFSAGAIFSFLAFLKTEKNKFALISSLCLGMALLSKYTATILFPFFILVSLIFFSHKAVSWGKDASEKIKKITLSLILIDLGSLLLFAIGMPAVFIIDGIFFESTIGFPGMEYFLWPLFVLQLVLLTEAHFFKSKFSLWIFSQTGILLEKYSRFFYVLLATVFLIALVNWIGNSNILGFGNLRFDIGKLPKFSKLPLYQQALYEIRPLIFSLTPIVLFGLLFFWIKMFFKKSFAFIAFVLSLFLVIFYSAMIFQGLMATIRYSIMLYPLVIVMASMGLYEMHQTKILKKINPLLISIALIIISSASLWLVKPFYFNYMNLLLPENKLVAGAWGYGGYEAAQYLNSLPNSENFKIWSDYPGVCEFTKGKCYITTQVENKDMDYFVLTRRGRINYPIRNDLVKAKEYYKKDNYLWRLDINNRPENYIKVYQNEK